MCLLFTWQHPIICIKYFNYTHIVFISNRHYDQIKRLGQDVAPFDNDIAIHGLLFHKSFYTILSTFCGFHPAILNLDYFACFWSLYTKLSSDLKYVV